MNGVLPPSTRLGCFLVSALWMSVEASVAPPHSGSSKKDEPVRFGSYAEVPINEYSSSSFPSNLEPSTPNTSMFAEPEEEDEPWTNNEEWWKDPLSMFDDNDEFIGSNQAEQDLTLDKQQPPLNDYSVDDDDDDYNDGVVEENLDEPAEIFDLSLPSQSLVNSEEHSQQLPSEEEMEEVIDPRLSRAKASATEKNRRKTMTKEADDSRPESSTPNRMSLLHEEGSPQFGRLYQEQALTNFASTTRKHVDPFVKMIPKVGSALSVIPGIRLLITVTLWKAVIENNLFKPRKNNKQSRPRDTTDSHYDDAQFYGYDQENGEDITMMDDEGEMDLDLPVPGSQRSTTSRSSSDQRRRHNDNNNNYNNNNHDHDSSKQARANNPVIREAGGWMGGIKNLVGGREHQKLPSARELLQDVQELRSKAEEAEVERNNMEREYEKTSWELQEAKGEVSSLTSSTKYLKAQLRDYEEFMERTVRKERRKAKLELQRLKEAMAMALEKERAVMREEFLQKTEQVNQETKEEGKTTIERRDESSSNIQESSNISNNSSGPSTLSNAMSKRDKNDNARFGLKRGELTPRGAAQPRSPMLNPKGGRPRRPF